MRVGQTINGMRVPSVFHLHDNRIQMTRPQSSKSTTPLTVSACSLRDQGIQSTCKSILFLKTSLQIQRESGFILPSQITAGEKIAVIGKPPGRTSRHDFTKTRKTNMVRLVLAPSGAQPRSQGLFPSLGAGREKPPS